MKLSTFAEVADIPPFVQHGKFWVADGWRQLGDVVPSPQFSQAVFAGLAPPPTSGFDCSALAAYEVAVIERSIAEGVLTDKVLRARFFCVNWWEGSEFRGHNVCALELPPFAPGSATRWAYLDNWAPNPSRGSLAELAEQVRQKNWGGVIPATPILCALLSPDLVVEQLERGE